MLAGRISLPCLKRAALIGEDHRPSVGWFAGLGGRSRLWGLIDWSLGLGRLLAGGLGFCVFFESQLLGGGWRSCQKMFALSQLGLLAQFLTEPYGLSEKGSEEFLAGEASSEAGLQEFWSPQAMSSISTSQENTKPTAATLSIRDLPCSIGRFDLLEVGCVPCTHAVALLECWVRKKVTSSRGQQ